MTRNTLTYLHDQIWKILEEGKLQAEWAKIMETIRNNNIVNSINAEKNMITKLYNDQLNEREIAKLNETIRSNLVKEQETLRHNLETETETNRHNMIQEQLQEVENSIKQFDAQTARMNATTSIKNANTQERKLVTDIIGSAVRGAGVAAGGYILGKSAASAPLLAYIKGMSHGKFIDAVSSGAAKAGQTIYDVFGSLSDKVPTLVRGITIPYLVTKVAKNVTGSSDPNVNLFNQFRKEGLSREEAMERVERLAEDAQETQIKGKVYKGGKDEAITQAFSDVSQSGNSSPTQGIGPDIGVESGTNKAKSKVISSPSVAKRKEEGPGGIGLAFS